MAGLLPDPAPRPRHHTIISVDDHLIEPPDLFEGRMPPQYVDVAPRVVDARARLGPVATVVDGGHTIEMRTLSTDLAGRGVERLMVEGGGKVHTQFLTDDLADELQLVVAPVFVGDSQAPRFVRDGVFPWNSGRRATLADVRRIGDVVLLRYALSPRFRTD